MPRVPPSKNNTSQELAAIYGCTGNIPSTLGCVCVDHGISVNGGNMCNNNDSADYSFMADVGLRFGAAFCVEEGGAVERVARGAKPEGRGG